MVKRLIMIISLCLVAVIIVACSSGGGTGDTSSNSTSSDMTTSTATAISSPEASATTSATSPMHIAGVSVAVNPSMLSHVTCGGTTDLSYTATISVNAGSSGGQVTFTWNANGATTPGSVTFAPGDTSKTVSYALNNVAIQYGATANTAVTLTINSNGQTITAKPSGNCTFPGPFVVTGVSASVSPASVTGIHCGTTITMVYTVTVTIAPNSNGGTVVVNMIVGNYHRAGSVAFPPGTTVQHLTFSTTPTINHFAPPPLTFASTTPNAVSSAATKPAGQCS